MGLVGKRQIDKVPDEQQWVCPFVFVKFAKWINKPVCFAEHLYANHRKDFKPIRGAAGFQLGNPSALAVTALLASLEIFSLTSMSVIRSKSVALTAYLEALLLQPESIGGKSNQTQPFQIITPSNPTERGAQLSVRLKPGILEGVLEVLKEDGVVVDGREPDVIRVAPAPLYNTYSDVWEFARLFRNACQKVEAEQTTDAEEANREPNGRQS